MQEGNLHFCQSVLTLITLEYEPISTVLFGKEQIMANNKDSKGRKYKASERGTKGLGGFYLTTLSYLQPSQSGRW
jgi:hypothetical protein